MNISDLDDPRYCGNCGTKLLPDKRCPNNCTVVTYVHESSTVYPKTSIPPTKPSFSLTTPPSLPQPKSNRMYLLVIAILLIIMLIGGGVFAGILIGKNNPQASTGSSQNHINSSGIQFLTPLLTPENQNIPIALRLRETR